MSTQSVPLRGRKRKVWQHQNSPGA
eukprot:SAG22_NODE_7480_length_735_cov_1.812893_2_plen_24_part_01